MDLSIFNINFWILQSIAMGLTALFIPRLQITSFFGATTTVVCLALINAHLWDAALFFSVPDSLTTQAITVFLANGIIFWILVKILPGIEVSGILPALVAPAVFSVCSLVLSNYASRIDFIELAKEAIVQVEALRDSLKTEELQEPVVDEKSPVSEKLRNETTPVPLKTKKTDSPKTEKPHTWVKDNRH